MTEKEKYLIIKKHIDRMDYYNLLAGGAPSDEFDYESREINTRVRPDHSAQEIADMIASVFYDAFGEPVASSVFLPTAQQIKHEFQI